MANLSLLFMKDYQKHVLDSLNMEPSVAFCGAIIQPFEWHFRTAECAFSSALSGNRLMPCPDCVNAIFKKLDGELGYELPTCWF